MRICTRGEPDSRLMNVYHLEKSSEEVGEISKCDVILVLGRATPPPGGDANIKIYNLTKGFKGRAYETDINTRTKEV